MTTRVAIVGVAGYAGGELARLLLSHPEVELAYVSSNSAAGMRLAEVFPGLLGRTDLVCSKFAMADVLDSADIVFSAQENGWAAENAGALLAAGKIVIDISADFRLRDRETYSTWYKRDAAPAEILSKAVYGLPELWRDRVKGAKLVANPGCYPTSAILAIAPAIANGLIDEDHIVINSMSGVSGAGRSKQSLQYHFPEVNESASAYGIAGRHRHTPEIEQALSDVAGHAVRVSFTPHLIPITRGILTTAVAPLLGASSEQVYATYEMAYATEPFVHVLPCGRFPTTKQTAGTNNVLLDVAVDARLGVLTVVSAEDNLIKGAAGQAIQNMNIICGFDETTGLTQGGIWP
jgi:N-acetyl-gamma-glutamyl-phosphate reductase